MVKIKNLAIGYGNRRVLQKTDLHVYPGECMALLGASESGKTSLLRSIAGLAPLVEGEIWLDGSIASLPGRHMKPHARSIAMVFQEPSLWPHLTVRQHLEFAAGRCKKMLKQMRVAYLLERVGLVDVENKYPGQLTVVEQQRLELGRALARQPRILLLDEPLSTLDTRIRQKLLLDIARIIKEFYMTTIYATREWKEAVFIADRVAALGDGRIESVIFADHYTPAEGSPFENGSPADRFSTRGKVIHMNFHRNQ
ncbi:MAG TPA: ABC transporter ATP-binding protein [Desulfobacterales bacterium]